MNGISVLKLWVDGAARFEEQISLQLNIDRCQLVQHNFFLLEPRLFVVKFFGLFES
jgi:hypothetical protein